MIQSLEEKVSVVRKVNRRFAKKIGLLREGLLESPYSLTEATILFEIGSHADFTASETDNRHRLLSLTAKDTEAFDLINNRAKDEIAEMLGVLSEEKQNIRLRAIWMSGEPCSPVSVPSTQLWFI
jgi:hypothetical protein